MNQKDSFAYAKIARSAPTQKVGGTSKLLERVVSLRERIVMIETNSIRNADLTNFDSVYAIVRSYKRPIPGVAQLAVLSPKQELFWHYRKLANNGMWNQEAFDNDYAPRFLNSIVNNPEAIATLKSLKERSDRGERIQLLCYCSDYHTCHRSLIGEILQCNGVDVVIK